VPADRPASIEPLLAMAEVLVVIAMESEAVHLRRRLADVQEIPSPAPRWPFARGMLHGCEVSVLVCGVGEANAAGGTAAVLAGGWRPRAVLNYGCAGAHEVSIREGDVVRLLLLLLLLPHLRPADQRTSQRQRQR
jgi:nucleoside phosphorylase